MTVKPAHDLTGPLTSEAVHATIVRADGSHRTVNLRALEEAGVVSGVRQGEDRSIAVREATVHGIDFRVRADGTG